MTVHVGEFLRRGDAAVQPTPRAAFSAMRPVNGSQVRLAEGFWLDRAQTNRDGSIATALRHLESWGALPYLRAAAIRGPAPAVPAHNDALVYKILDSDVYKWLEAVAQEGLRSGLGDYLTRAADDVVDLVVAAQWPSGYLHSWTSVHRPEAPFSEWRDGTELYCAGHLLQAAVAWKRAFDDDRLLGVAVRLADLISGGSEHAPEHLLSAHPGLEMAFVELYRTTGDEHYLRSAREQLERRGHGLLGSYWYTPDHFLDHRPLRECRTIQGHAVMSLFLLCGAVDVAVETGDAELLAVAESQWQDMVDRKLYITGGVGSRHHDEGFGDPYELAPDTAYAETCAAVASVMLSWRLLLATGKSRYAELIERTLYNAVLPGVSQDGLSYLYVNPLQQRVPGRILTPDGYGHRQAWFACACCPPNLMRVIASVGQLAVTWTDDSVDVQQLIDADVTVTDRAVAVRSDLPFGAGVATVTVTRAGVGEWALRVRRPEWAPTAHFSTSWGDRGELVADEAGYATFRRAWRDGDKVDLVVEPRVTAYAADSHADAYRGQVALVRGPLVYCFEDADLPEGADVDDVHVALGREAVQETPIVGLDGLLGLRVPVTIRQELPAEALYRPVGVQHDTPGRSSTATAIPYFAWGNRGAGRMRVWVPQARE